jgi:hypothetical protein
MSNDQDDDEQTETLPAPVPYDRFADAIELCRIFRKAGTTEAALIKARKAERKEAAAEQRTAALTAQAEQREAELAQRAAELAEGERALEIARGDFETSLAEAHATLRASHDNLSDVDRRLRYRILTHAGLLAGFNEELQTLPNWQQIKQLVPNLPDDLPAPPAEVVSENVSEDWAGSAFVSGSTVTRTVRGAA